MRSILAVIFIIVIIIIIIIKTKKSSSSPLHHFGPSLRTMLILQVLRGGCPCCSRLFTHVYVYINLECDVYLLIFMHEDGTCCPGTSIEDCPWVDVREEYFSSGYI